MTTLLIALGIIAYPIFILFLARFLGHWRTDVPRIDYCTEPECMKSGKCYSGDCR